MKRVPTEIVIGTMFSPLPKSAYWITIDADKRLVTLKDQRGRIAGRYQLGGRVYDPRRRSVKVTVSPALITGLRGLAARMERLAKRELALAVRRNLQSKRRARR